MKIVNIGGYGHSVSVFDEIIQMDEAKPEFSMDLPFMLTNLCMTAQESADDDVENIR